MFNQKMKRLKYVALSSGVSILLFTFAVLLGGTFSQKVNGLDMLKIYSAPWYFLMTVFFLRRLSNVLDKEWNIYVNITLAVFIAALGAFVPEFKPKFLMIPFLLVAFLPSKRITGSI